MKTLFSSHFHEIRIRSIYLFFSFFFTFLICYKFSFELIYLFIKPFSFFSKNFIFTDLTEAFSILIKLCFLTTFFVILPLFFYQMWCFIIPSFFDKERKTLNYFLKLFCVLFILCFLLSYSFILPEIYKFFLNFEIQTSIFNIHLEARISSYISKSLSLYFFLFVAFQFPFILYILYKYKKISPTFFSKNRKYIFFILTLVASILSPPDVMTQCFLIFLLLCISEVTIWSGFVFEKRSLIFIANQQKL